MRSCEQCSSEFVMPMPYSEDLHWRVVWLNVFLELGAHNVAKYMHVKGWCIYAEQFRFTGDVRWSVKRNGPTHLLKEYEEVLLTQHILAYPGVYLRELQLMVCNSIGCMHMVDTNTTLQKTDDYFNQRVWLS